MCAKKITNIISINMKKILVALMLGCLVSIAGFCQKGTLVQQIATEKVNLNTSQYAEEYLFMKAILTTNLETNNRMKSLEIIGKRYNNIVSIIVIDDQINELIEALKYIQTELSPQIFPYPTVYTYSFGGSSVQYNSQYKKLIIASSGTEVQFNSDVTYSMITAITKLQTKLNTI